MCSLNPFPFFFRLCICIGILGGMLSGCELPEEKPASDDAPQEFVELSDIEKEVCCEHQDGSFSFTNLKACNKTDGTPVADELCQQSAPNLCCDLDGIYQFLANDECKAEGGTPATLEECEKICCGTDHPTFTITTLGGCNDIGGFELDQAYCDPDPADVCCKTGSGLVWLPITQCDPNQVLPDSYCDTQQPEEVCCATQDGLAAYFTMSDQCADGSLLPLSDCDPHADICCRFPDGFQIVNMEECPPEWVSQDQSYCNQDPVEVCCKTADGNVFLPEDQCDPALVQPAEACDPVGTVCCKTPDGNIFVPADQCDPSQVQADEICDTTATVCCDTQGGAVPTPADQCDAALVLPDSSCEDYATVCCETPNGAAFMSSMDCPVTHIFPGEVCWEPIWNNQLVCCSDVNGQGLGWATQANCSGTVLTVPECDGVPIP